MATSRADVHRSPPPVRPRLVADAEHEVARPDASAPATDQPRAEAPAKPAQASAQTPAASGSPKRSRKTLILGAVAAVALVAGLWYGYDWWTTGRFMVETDDAYVGADMATMAPKISGYVATVAVEDNARVKAGDPLVTLDPGDYKLSLDAADAKIATQQASILRFDSQIAASAAQIDQAQAQVDSAAAARDRTVADFGRAQALVNSSYGSRQTLDQARAARDQAVAAYASAEAGVTAAKANRDVLVAQKAEARRTLGELEVNRAQRQRDYDATIIRAPFDGVVGNKGVQTGDYVTPGKRLLAVVPLDRVYVDANFKETQLVDLAPGQRVRLAVDAYPEHDATGVVDSLAPAAGAVFSLLPPENATGNFTKIVQRVPVRIRVAPEDVAKGRLRPGLSVVATVDIRTTPATPSSASAGTR
ncbi:membrane fusion protein (multidrug efflux system) [Methylopila capsulata]|uniref:Membrane fusion protein (Multidrug efflux system) n=1 Tax=Methylopila capsulata TaxID=61654 RepID=A0ABS2T5W5_9HYPH|nr:HlyD family secretion protein [Methylopila capsulata]MBM7851250.1 membrane fusion protein (multidrug efflux system) [Methylopila capsulata]